MTAGVIVGDSHDSNQYGRAANARVRPSPPKRAGRAPDWGYRTHIFTTGASGWIGSAVVSELLAADHEVLGLKERARLRDGSAVTGWGLQRLPGCPCRDGAAVGWRGRGIVLFRSTPLCGFRRRMRLG